MFRILIFVINLDIRIGFSDFFSWLPVHVRLVTLQIQICFVPPYKIHSGISYISVQVRIVIFFVWVQLGLRIMVI